MLYSATFPVTVKAFKEKFLRCVAGAALYPGGISKRHHLDVLMHQGAPAICR